MLGRKFVGDLLLICGASLFLILVSFWLYGYLMIRLIYLLVRNCERVCLLSIRLQNGPVYEYLPNNISSSELFVCYVSLPLQDPNYCLSLGHIVLQTSFLIDCKVNNSPHKLLTTKDWIFIHLSDNFVTLCTLFICIPFISSFCSYICGKLNGSYFQVYLMLWMSFRMYPSSLSVW